MMSINCGRFDFSMGLDYSMQLEHAHLCSVCGRRLKAGAGGEGHFKLALFGAKSKYNRCCCCGDLVENPDQEYKNAWDKWASNHFVGIKHSTLNEQAQARLDVLWC